MGSVMESAISRTSIRAKSLQINSAGERYTIAAVKHKVGVVQHVSNNASAGSPIADLEGACADGGVA